MAHFLYIGDSYHHDTPAAVVPFKTTRRRQRVTRYRIKAGSICNVIQPRGGFKSEKDAIAYMAHTEVLFRQVGV